MKNHIQIDNKIFIGDSTIIGNLTLLKHLYIPLQELSIDKYKCLDIHSKCKNTYNFICLKKSRSIDKLYLYGRMSDSDIDIEYNYIYSYVHLLLEKYDGKYKEFYLFNNTDDWKFFTNSIENREHTYTLMIQWINIIARAIKDAIKESKSTIKIYYYLEMKNDIENITSKILPHVDIELVAYHNTVNNTNTNTTNTTTTHTIIDYIYNHMTHTQAERPYSI